MKYKEFNLVAVTEDSHDIMIDLKYGTTDNFTGALIYKKQNCFLHIDADVKFKKAIELAGKLDYRFRLFDAFRPQEAQEKLWAHTPDPNFLADPARGSAHSRGLAVDLTLMDKDNNDLDMGTAFDAFSPLSHHAVTEISEEAQRNRFLLLGIMSAAGWDFYKNEWWHYQMFDARQYPLIHDSEAGTEMM